MSMIFLILLISLNIFCFLFLASLKDYVFAAIALSLFAFILGLLLSPAPKRGIEIFGDQAKIDERDVIFARFDLPEDTQVFKDYYKEHPELVSADQQIRKMSGLFAPAHVRKDPILLSLAAAEFDFLEHQITEVDGKPGEATELLSKEKNTRLIKRIVGYLGSDLYGICRMNQSYVYSHIGRGPEAYGREVTLDHRFAIVFAVEMNLAMVAAAPRAPVVVETGKQYIEAARISIILADMIRRLGYPARAHVAGSNYQAILPPLGWEAGLGELGRLGTLITTKYGPRARLGLVTTSLPLIPDKTKLLGIQDFCEKCRKCAKNCPAQAIPFGGKEKDNGVLKWVLNREECYRYWRKSGTDCAICMYVCPFSKPTGLFHSLIRTAAAKSSLAQTISVWGDDFFYGRKPVRKKSPI